MQIMFHAIKDDVNFVSAAGEVLGMERLMDVAEEMQHESQTLSALPEREGKVTHAIRVVCYGGHYASFVGQAVACQIDPAFVRWVVLRVNVVPWRGVGERRDVPDPVGEEGCGRGVLVVEEHREECVCGVPGRNVQEGEGCGGAVA